MNQTNPQADSIKSRYWVVVPAAGIGSRMNAQIAKQYLPLAGKTILEQTLSRLLSCDLIVGLVVCVSADDDCWGRLETSKDSRIHTVIGGAERADSVLNGLSFLRDKVQPQDFILVHDAARPCISVDQINYLCNQLKEDPVGGILALPSSDTLKQVNQSQIITQTLDRQVIWQAQTPQMFRYQILFDCLSKARNEKKMVTDEASAVEIFGYAAKVVVGSRDNIKVTRPEDLKLAEFIFSQQEKG